MKSKSSDQRTFWPSTTAPRGPARCRPGRSARRPPSSGSSGSGPSSRGARAAVVLERAREDALPGRERGRGDRRPSKPVIFQPAKVNETALERSIRSPSRRSSLTRTSSSRGTPRAPVRARVAVGEEPLAAARPVLPPLTLHAGDVVAEVHVLGQLTQRGRARWTLRDLAEVGVLVDRPGGPQKGQARRNDIS